MMQEDSNGESTFEFVDKKSDDMSNSLETMPKTDSLSSLSSSSVSLVPSATGLVPTGSLLTNVPPPSALPSFVTSESSPQHFASASSVTSQISGASYQPPAPSSLSQPISAPPLAFHQTQFCPVIPASKGGPPPSLTGAGGSPATPEVAVEVGEQAGGDGSAGLFGWVRGVAGGVTSSNLLSRMAEKARNSVDSMITTLDPQMREFLHSGGDVDIVVASDKEVKVSPVREAFQAVFGKATVTGLAAQPTNIAAQPVGFEAATTAARERIIAVRATHGLPAQQPVLAVENFLLEISPDKWFDIGLLLLSDPGQALELSTFTQGTPVPAPIVALAREATPADYPLKASGLATTVGSLMGQNLQVPPSQWHEALTGVPRREMVLIAARALAGMYKSSNRSLL
ncbi:hypothetical protein R5R35_007522 [Gryllus longicercus]|uniref:Non-canonical purine NTP phosphatase/PRRC1 domain-containing protein n=1 Tax=Gryllus longicercus TaxID=2509291 RepID=A0AAN9V8Z4_9ORTH